MKLEADGIGGEGAAGKPHPFDRALTLFDTLLARAAPVVEGADSLGEPRHVGDDVRIGTLFEPQSALKADPISMPVNT